MNGPWTVWSLMTAAVIQRPSWATARGLKVTIKERDHVSAPTRQELISALVAMPQRELVEVIALALENRTPEVSRPEWEESRLALVEAHRFNEASGGPSDWELLLLARPSTLGEFVTDGGGPTQEGGCCGQTLASYSKRIVCPICGSPASAT